MVDQMFSGPSGTSFTFSTPYVQQVTQELDSAMEQVLKLMGGNKKLYYLHFPSLTFLHTFLFGFSILDNYATLKFQI